MGIVADDKSLYERAIRKLLPRGAWWDRQLADPESDVALFARAKAGELYGYRQRMAALFAESVPDTTEEAISDWERVLLGEVSRGLTLAERRMRLRSRENVRLNRAELARIAGLFGLALLDIRLPFRPRFFGHARHGHERLGGFAAFSVLRLVLGDPNFVNDIWGAVRRGHRHKSFGLARFGVEHMAFFPVYAMRGIVRGGINRDRFGHGRPAQDRIAPFPLDEARRLARERLGRGRILSLHFGQSQLALFAGRFDPALVFDIDFFGAYVDEILRRAGFAGRFARLIANEYIARAKPYRAVEEAIGGVLLANHISIFRYQGV